MPRRAAAGTEVRWRGDQGSFERAGARPRTGRRSAHARPPRYTVRDTPETVARVGADLAAVQRAVREADPSLRSLVLTGGFARGEGAVLAGQPQNDYDFVAFRGPGRPEVPYAEVAQRLEARLGLHVDLAPVAAWRIPWLARSIFWYETALRGRTLWGEDLLPRIRVRSLADLDPAEGLRLLVNRAAGLLLVTGDRDPHARRIQASKGLLAALDTHLLAAGAFAPSQAERWQALRVLREADAAPPAVEGVRGWMEWAFRFKVDPERAPEVDADDAWAAARQAILDAVPVALRHAGLDGLDAYATREGPVVGLVDRAIWWRRSARLPEARRLAAHPTGRLRVATLRLLEEAADGRVPPERAAAALAPLARGAQEPLRLLDGLRRATLQ
jgi:hypothetical protein